MSLFIIRVTKARLFPMCSTPPDLWSLWCDLDSQRLTGKWILTSQSSQKVTCLEHGAKILFYRC